MKVGVITATRGEGGGNAVGLGEGPALELIREAEKRDAVGLAGIEHIYNLDALDFFYTASAPLSREVWGGEELLGRIVRVERADPWRWGQVSLEGLEDAGSEPKDAVLPSTAARSVDSPLSIIQSAGDRVPLGGHSPTSPHLEIVSVERKKGRITAVVHAPVKGAAKLFVWDDEGVLAEMERNMPAGERRVNMRVPGLPSALETTEVTVLASFQSEDTVSAAARRLE